MESPTPVSRYVHQNSKKRVFPGGSSSSVCKDVEVLEIAPPANHTSKPKSSEQKETMGGIPIHSSSSVISLQSQKDQGSGSVSSGPDSKPKKICCACPDTKKLRDECIVEHGESACEKWIEAHRKCLRAEGFKV